MKICPDHKIEADFKEGISKTTNKGYSFWACPLKTPEGEFCKAKIIEGEAVNPKSAAQFENGLKDERSRRIERQHSQEMAIRFLEILVQTGQLKEASIKLIQQYTNHFERDLETL